MKQQEPLTDEDILERFANVARDTNEQDAVLEKLQRRIEALERANLDVLAYLEWRAKQRARKKKR